MTLTDTSRPSKGASGLDVKVKDIAEIAGVSSTTVSLGLRDSPLVSQRTRARVQAVARELNYQPNASARMMRQGKTHTIGVVLAQMPYVPSPGLIEACSLALLKIAEVLSHHHYHLSFVPISPVAAENWDRPMPRIFNEIAADGLVVIHPPTPPLQEVIDRLGRPYVLLDAAPQDGVCTVGVDECRAAELAVEHLYELGHRRIAYLAGGIEIDPYPHAPVVHRCQAFHQGYVRGMNRFGLATLFSLDDQAALKDEFNTFWDAPDPPTAAVVYGVDAARLVNSWVIDRGLSVPEDVSIVSLLHTGSHPDLDLGQLPPVTCKINMQDQMAEIAVEKLLQIIAKPSAGVPESVLLEPEFIVRGSSGPCVASS